MPVGKVGGGEGNSAPKAPRHFPHEGEILAARDPVGVRARHADAHGAARRERGRERRVGPPRQDHCDRSGEERGEEARGETLVEGAAAHFFFLLFMTHGAF